MKPFSLEDYLKNPSRKVVTRDGRKVRIICTDRKGDTPIIALVYNANEGREYGYAFNSDGKYFNYKDDDIDLFFAPEKHEGYVHIIRNEVYNEAYCGKIYDSKEEAESKANNATIAIARIEWEE